jgi:PAT family beta-lactamase induction signal transducer AmpG
MIENCIAQGRTVMSKKAKLRELGLALTRKRMWINLLLGFSAGLPIMIVFSVVKIWARREGVDLSTIGLMGLVALPYSLNFLMGPILDRYTPFSLGRRRSWLIITQIGLVLSIFSLGFCDPKSSMSLVALSTLFIAIFGAVQDVAIDAYRREILPDEEIGIGASIYVYGYRVGMLVTSGGGVWLADPDTMALSFNQVFQIISLFMLVGVATTFIASEPEVEGEGPKNLQEAVVDPFVEFIKRRGWGAAVSILAFIFFFKFGDALVGTMLSTFYVDMGYSNKVIAEVTKGIGFFSTMAGLGVGSLAIYRFGVVPSLFCFGVLQCISTSLFSILTFASLKGTWWGLAIVIGFEDFSSGLGTTALISFMATMTNKKYTATQYALFASLAALGKTLFGSFAGYIVEGIGYVPFFYLGSLLATPGLALIFVMNRLKEPEVLDEVKADSLTSSSVTPS